jgi:4'-phosphopantetheinyl transferase
MTSSAITVWRIDLRDAGVDAAPRSGFLDPVEIGRAARMRDRLEAERWAYAHAAMRAILARDLGVAESAVVYVHGADEKPCIAGAPSGWDFNLTHSGDLAWLAIARGGAVGIDLERISESVEWRPLLDLVCTPAEAGYVLALPEVSRRERFHRIWVRKESLLKAAGIGFGTPQPLQEIDVLETSTGFDGRRWWLLDLPAPEGYAAALTASTSEVTLTWRDWAAHD